MPLLKPTHLALAFYLVSASLATAQTADCPCTRSFDFAVEKIGLNYAGFQDKVNPATKAAYEQHTQAIRAKAAQAKTEEECFWIMREWTDFFRDRHTGISLNSGSGITETDPEKLRAMFAGTETIPMTEKEAKAYLGKNKRSLDPVEGIYESGAYRLVIIKSPKPGRDFAGIVLKADSVWWMPGQVKMELKKEADGYATKFYMKDHTLQQHKSKLAGSQLQVGGLAAYNKLYPAPPATAAAAAKPVAAAKPGSTFSLVELSPKTLLLTLPSFDHRFKPVIDSLLRVNEAKLARTPNLIIDVRSNGGGSDISYSGIIPYLYTNPIIGINSAIWASADNIGKFQSLLDDPTFPDKGKKDLQQLIDKMHANLGTFIDRPNDTTTLAKVHPNPAKVAVLMGPECSSSCEQFVLAAKASKKVTLYGKNTAGVIDYANMHSLDMPCGNMSLYYATSRTKRLPHFPIDNIGIAPDVRINPEVEDQVKHVQRLLEPGR